MIPSRTSQVGLVNMGRSRSSSVTATCAAWAMLALACGGADGTEDGASTAGSSGASSSGTAASSTEGSTGTTAADAGSDSSASDESTTAASPGWVIAYEADEDIGGLLSTWGPDASHVYAVGGQTGDGGFSAGAMLVRTDGAWSPTTLPADTPKLNWIHGQGATRVAVGEYGTILMRDGDDDGTAWSVFGCGTVLPLWGAWVFAADDAWAVGGDGFNRPPVLCHWDGAAWTLQDLPTIEVVSHGLFKLFGVAPDDLWAVGDAGLLLHRDAVGWSQVAIDTDADLISLWGLGADTLLAVGGRASGVVARYDGSAWTVADVAVPGLNGSWMADDGETHVVGPQGSIARIGAGGLDATIEDAPTFETLHAVWGPGDGSLIAVGGSIDLPPPFIGIILERAP